MKVSTLNDHMMILLNGPDFQEFEAGEMFELWKKLD